MATGIATPNARVTTRRAVTTIASPISRFQPTCRLGIAAYWLVKAAGWSTRYECDVKLTVSAMPRPARRGGATGNRANSTRPIPPETIIALRVRRNTSGLRRASHTRVTTTTGQCPQM